MREPWGVSKIYSITDPNYRGLMYIEPEPLYRAVRLALQNDLQFTAHSVGDGAVHALMAAYERVNKEFPVRDAAPVHHAFELHVAGGDREDARARRRGGPAACVAGARRGNTARAVRRCRGFGIFQPYKSLFEAGVMVGGGSDHMQKVGSMRAINPYNPFYGMWVTLARQPRWTQSATAPGGANFARAGDSPVHDQQRVSDVRRKGERFAREGKLADFIVLQQDILTCPLEQVKNIKVAQTWVGGKQVYEAKSTLAVMHQWRGTER